MVDGATRRDSVRDAQCDHSRHRGRTVIGRRGFLALAALSTVSACSIGDDAVTVRLGSGRVGGLSHTFARLLADAAAEAGTVRIDPVITAGSCTNLDLLGRGEIDAALALSDSARESRTRALAIGRLHECYLHLAVPAESPIHRVEDLRGARVDLGALGSGAEISAERVVRAAGLDPTADLQVSHRQLSDAVSALYAGEVDAIMWGAGVPTPGPDIPRRLRLIDLGGLVTVMRERFEFDYHRVTIPADSYPGSPAVSTVGVPNLLLAKPDLAHSAVSAITELLLQRADGLAPTRTVGFQFLNRRWLVGTDAIPIHPASVDVYRAWHG